jgi:hypothetical protein
VSGLDDVRRWTRALSGCVVDLPDDGFDFAAYFRVSSRLPHRWLCLLNTHSRIASHGWLDKLRSAAELAGVGAAGATGSWGTMTPRWRGPGASLAGLVAWPARFAGRIPRFPVFPNPHLRSNALVLKTRLLVAFGERFPLPRRKENAHFLESGRGGLTSFLRSRGLRPVVVGGDGRRFEPDDWIFSRTFRVPGQPNLMIADNQTKAYAQSDCRQRQILEFAAWGQIFSR